MRNTDPPAPDWSWQVLAPQMLAAFDAPVVLTDRQGVIAYVNPAFTQVTGYAADEAIGQRPSLLRSGMHDTAFYQRLWTTILSGRTWSGQLVNRRKSGELYTDLQRITPLRDASGAITHFMAVKTDVTTQLRSLTGTSPVGVFHADTAGSWTYVNDRLQQLTNRSLGELVAAGWRDAIDPRDRDVVAGAWADLVGGASDELSAYVRLAGVNGSKVWVHLRAVRHHADVAEPDIGFVGSVEEVDDLVRARDRLAEQEAHLRTILRTVPDGLLVIDQDGRIDAANAAAAALFGWREPDLLGRPIVTLFPTEDPREPGPGSGAREITARHRDGRPIPVELSLSQAHVEGSAVLIGVVRDITERKAAEAALTFEAQHDPLTGLANRTLLQGRLADALHATARDGLPLAVLLIDLDGFKQINDGQGHAVGDDVLIGAAQALTRAVRGADTVARIGGDEFLVLAHPVAGPASAAELAERCLRALRATRAGTGPVRASIGVAVVAGPGHVASGVLAAADAAMYRAKSAGGDRHEGARELLAG